MSRNAKQAAGARRNARERERAEAKKRHAAPPLPPVARAFPAQHPYREARASGLLARVEQLVARQPAEERRERLRAEGFDHHAFAQLAEGHRSAWALARAHFWLPSDNARDRATRGIYVALLWRDYLPERPSMEHIDDCLEAGSLALERGDREGALRHWLTFWSSLTSAAPHGARAKELDGYLMSLKIKDWFEVFDLEAKTLGAEHPLAPELASARAEILSRLADSG